MDKINEIIDYINNKEAASLTKNNKNMRIYYFNGNKVKGIDLTNILEDISISMQKEKALRQAGFKVDIFKYKSLQECIDFANNAGYTCTMVQPN